MKPSERVLKWAKFFNEQTRKENSSLENTLSAIIQVMDEEYEKKQPCEHIGTDTEFINGVPYCDNCKERLD